MYIRRKVFSLLQNEYGEERYYSTTEFTLKDAEERIFVSKAEKEAKMQLAREILEAEEAGDRGKARYLKKRFVKKDRKLAKGIGMMAGSTLGGMTGFAAGQGSDLDDDKSAGLGVLGAGAGTGIGAAIGHNIGRRISNDRLDRYMNAAKKEKESKKGNKKD